MHESPSPSEWLPGERQRLILERLGREGRVFAGDLARQFSISEDSIRRDLRDLAAIGLCKRVYGGALPLSPTPGSLTERQAQAVGPKRALGEKLASLVTPGQIVFIDAGSTNLAGARALPEDSQITVVTNAPAIGAVVAGRRGIELVMIGGRVDPATGAAVGVKALRELAEIRLGLYWLGACAVDVREGIATFDIDEAEFRRTLAGLAGAVVLAATNDKLGTSAPFRIDDVGVLSDLVVESDAPEDLLEPLRERGVRVHRADPAADPAKEG